jgi:hypothetical protein
VVNSTDIDYESSLLAIGQPAYLLDLIAEAPALLSVYDIHRIESLYETVVYL